jgi:hypothetical protein
MNTENLENKFIEKTPKSNNEYKIVFFGKMLNRNGDIEQLFSSFDALTAEVKNNFANHSIAIIKY